MSTDFNFTDIKITESEGLTTNGFHRILLDSIQNKMQSRWNIQERKQIFMLPEPDNATAIWCKVQNVKEHQFLELVSQNFIEMMQCTCDFTFGSQTYFLHKNTGRMLRIIPRRKYVADYARLFIFLHHHSADMFTCTFVGTNTSDIEKMGLYRLTNMSEPNERGIIIKFMEELKTTLENFGYPEIPHYLSFDMFDGKRASGARCDFFTLLSTLQENSRKKPQICSTSHSYSSDSKTSTW